MTPIKLRKNQIVRVFFQSVNPVNGGTLGKYMENIIADFGD